MQPHEALKPLATRDNDPVFEEAWQAQALALADCLIREGVFTATDWATVLGACVCEQDSTTEGYYLAVLSALEGLLDKGELPAPELKTRRDAWARAYENTPHGEPVKLKLGLSETSQ